MLLNQLFSQNAKLMTETAGSVIRSDSVKGPHPHGQQGTSETLNHLDEKVLSPAELNKRDNLTVFLQKLANREPFVPAGGETPSIIIQVDAETLENIRAGKIPSVFKTADGATIRLSQLEKTTEFDPATKKDLYISLKPFTFGLHEERTNISVEKFLLIISDGVKK